MATALKDIPFKSEFPTINEHGAFVDLKIGTPCDCGVYAEMTYCDNCGVVTIYNQCGGSVAVDCANWTYNAGCANYACHANCACWACWACCACWAGYANCAYNSEYANSLICNCGCGNSTTISYDELTSNPYNYNIVVF